MLEILPTVTSLCLVKTLIQYDRIFVLMNHTRITLSLGELYVKYKTHAIQKNEVMGLELGSERKIESS